MANAKRTPKTKTKGRPKGSKTTNLETAEGLLTQCPNCRSTNRTPYTNRTELAFAGIRDGKHFTHVITRRTSCADCGQARFDKHFENRRRN